METIQPEFMNQKPRVLLVENDLRAREAYNILLQYWNYEPILALGEGRALIEDARTKAKQARCLLALIDLRLLDDYDEEDTSGLKLATQVGTIRSILLSGNLNQKVLLELLNRHKDIPFINKAASAEEKRRMLDTEMAKISAVKRGLQIDPPELMNEIVGTTFGSLTGAYSDQVADTFAQLFPSATKLRIERLEAGSSAHASGVPRPGSVVLRVIEDDLEPVVVKLARAGKIGIEVQSYEKFIFRRLSGSFVARLEHSAIQWDIGGALYSYIGDFDVKTFSDYYEAHAIEDIRECLNTFFTISWRNHYERTRDQNNISLFDLYGLVWGNWYEKRVKNFRSRASLYNLEAHEKFGLPEPIEWFKKNIAESKEKDLSFVENTRMAVTHGDLHGDNLLIDNQRNAWVIDFERTGEGHALQDFIELESDIINRLEAHSEDTFSYYQMCLTVARQTQIKELEPAEMESTDPRIQKALQIISTLRSLARRCTGITDARQYLLGLLFNTIFRATINNSEKHHERQSRALMLAGIFCHRLEHWNEPWPPEEWQDILNTRRKYA